GPGPGFQCGTDITNGDVTVPTGFSSYLYVTTTGGATGAGNLPSVFGSPGVSSTNGSTFTTSAFTTTAGELINFNFNYVTSDGAGYPDYAWAALINPTAPSDPNSNYLIFSAETNPTAGGPTVPGYTMPPLATGAALVPPFSPIEAGTGTLGPGGAGGPVWAELGSWSGYCYAVGCGLTGSNTPNWIESTFTGEKVGTYVLEFGVSNANDLSYDSGLAFAGVEVGGVPITGTPERSSLALIGTVLALAFLSLRRKTA